MGQRHGTFEDATPQRRCQVCDAPKRCSRARDGRTVTCYQRDIWGSLRGHQKTDRDGNPYWTFYLSADAALPVFEVQPSGPTAKLADLDVLNAFYREALRLLPLTSSDLQSLQARGLDEANGYGRVPPGSARRWDVARELAARFSLDVVRRCPGFVIREGAKGRTYPTLTGAPGILIPVRSVDGRIQACQIRVDQVDEAGGRYRWWSSARDGGPSSGSPVHVSLPHPDGRCSPERVRLTEGPLKGDVATFLDPERIRTVAVAGVGLWRQALPALRDMGAGIVRLAFDQDAEDKPEVARALADAIDGLRAAGFGLELDHWPREWNCKGIDDALLHARNA